MENKEIEFSFYFLHEIFIYFTLTHILFTYKDQLGPRRLKTSQKSYIDQAPLCIHSVSKHHSELNCGLRGGLGCNIPTENDQVVLGRNGLHCKKDRWRSG